MTDEQLDYLVNTAAQATKLKERVKELVRVKDMIAKGHPDIELTVSFGSCDPLLVPLTHEGQKRLRTWLVNELQVELEEASEAFRRFA